MDWLALDIQIVDAATAYILIHPGYDHGCWVVTGTSLRSSLRWLELAWFRDCVPCSAAHARRAAPILALLRAPMHVQIFLRFSSDFFEWCEI